MKNLLLEITENERIGEGLKRMRLRIGSMDAAAIRPGQFVNIRLDGLFLRRPISVCDVRGEELTLVYKVVGEGTEKLSRKLPGEELDVLLPLGNGFSLAECGERPLLIGGGVGTAPLLYLAEELLAKGIRPTVVMGFGSEKDIFLRTEFEALGIEPVIATLDGSVGVKGFVTDAVRDMGYSYVYTCGPEPMLRAVYQTIRTSGQFSFEERMGCGFGACMGCSCRTVSGYKRICKDGPVMRKEELLWED